MYTVTINRDQRTNLVGHLERTLSGLADLRPLGERIAARLREEVPRAAQAGQDRDGEPMIPINGGRPLTPAQAARRGGYGPPLSPRGAGSRVSADFVVEVNVPTDNAVFVVGSWPGLYWLKFHGSGPDHAARLPVRDIVGVRPEVDQEIVDMAQDYILSFVRPRE